MSQAAAILRRTQWAHGHKHMSPMRRPRYNMTSRAKQERRLHELLERTRAMQSRGKK